MATQPVLGTTNLPHPSTFRERVSYRGAFSEMADGSVAADLVNANAKRTFVIGWKMLNDTDKGTVATAFAAVKSSTATFTSPTGTSYTVTRDPQQSDIEFEATHTPGGFRWAVTMTLREV